MIGLGSKIKTIGWVCLLATISYMGFLTVSNFPNIHTVNSTVVTTTQTSHIYALDSTNFVENNSYVQSSLQELILQEQNTTSFNILGKTNNNKELYILLEGAFDNIDSEKHLDLLQGVIERIIELPEETLIQNNLNRDALLTSLGLIFINAPTTQVDSSQNLYGVNRINSSFVRLTLNNPADVYLASFHVNNSFYSHCSGEQCRSYLVGAEVGDLVTIYYTTGRGEQKNLTFTLQ